MEEEGTGFENEIVKIGTLFFADDGLVLASNIEDVRINIKILIDIGNKCGLEINKEKSSIIIFNMKDKPEEGSALDQHLQSTGYADYESTQTASFYQESHCSPGGEKKKVEWLLVRNKILDVIISLFWPKGLRKNFCKRIVRNAYESKLLISDDLLLLSISFLMTSFQLAS
ncbi:uncharacterized protein LOC135219893 [Macrobrachium nipponense]|uniref:uncharacterized protein LOC135219893 n=1 Tax=Macrobrachium nipponense TaxID=159736 RepID=UPI0030C7A214